MREQHAEHPAPAFCSCRFFHSYSLATTFQPTVSLKIEAQLLFVTFFNFGRFKFRAGETHRYKSKASLLLPIATRPWNDNTVRSPRGAKSCIVDARILAHLVDELQPREGLPCAVRSCSQLSPSGFR